MRRGRRVGHFTQEDPIGLAGGLNLYGYANGDPINNSDPFGLCPIELDGIPCTLTRAWQGAVGGMAAGAIIGGLGGTLVAPGVGTVVGAGGGALAGSVDGALIGATAGLIEDLNLGEVLERRLIITGAIFLGGIIGEGQGIASRIRDVIRTEQEANRRRKESEAARREEEKKKKKGSEGEPPKDDPPPSP